MTADALASAPRPRRRTTTARAAEQAATRHRLDVIASSVPDVVRSAGGWLADRALAGWDVNVFVPDTDDVAALRILGVTPQRLGELTALGDGPQPPTAVAVSADTVCADPRVRARLTAEFARDIGEVTVWGETLPDGLDELFHPVQHVLSAAARAFKSHAMRAAAIDEESVSATEVFHTGSTTSGAGAWPRLSAVDGRVRSTLPDAAVWAPAHRRIAR
jgi:hypothetical protein